ncbi:Histidine phosphatase superfamily, clade-2-containing protein [Aphelenchoides besseyi]|nr:Histidine phosphatase superfamily, clade-2-containing protein [Aphelenchoides besseyi]KAI6212157.1 Histidine phosphatase superfamily, clade-2-containing protein [Aphelenchoides besseyi]
MGNKLKRFLMQLMIIITSLFGLYGHVNSDRLATSTAEVDTLIHVHVIFRHGDRTPWLLMPSDLENALESWPEGLGELTQLGIEQQFQLGRILRHRYDHWLPQDYHSTLLYVQSSDRNRTLMSAQANMAGLFPVRSNLPVYPIPIHTKAFENDRIFNDRVVCPVAEEEERLVYKSTAYTEQAKKFAQLLQLLGESSGFGTVPLAYSDVWKVYDSLFAQFSHPDTHKMPRWVTQKLFTELSRAYDLSANGLYASNKLVRLRGGPILEDVVNRMDRKINDGSDVKDQRLYIYSGHDTTIGSFLATLSIIPQVFPGYAFAVMIELHKQPDGRHVVRLFYRNNTLTDDIFELEIPGCQQSCSFDHIKEIATKMVPKDWIKECGIEETTPIHESSTLLIVTTILSAVAVLFTTLILAVQFYQIKKQRQCSLTLPDP